MHRRRRDCPAYGQVCLKCNKSNQFASVCNEKWSNPVIVVLGEDDSDSDLSVVENVSTLTGKGRQVLTESTFCIDEADHVKYKTMVCQLDTGPSCNMISYRDLSIRLQNGMPNEWISSMVIVAKPGKIIICLDSRDLNKTIKRPKYQMPTLEDILPRPAKDKGILHDGCKRFSFLSDRS